MSMPIPLVPPAAASVAAVPVGSAPLMVVGMLNDIKQPTPAPVGQATAPVAPFDCTLKKMRSVPPVLLSVTGEQVVFALETDKTVVLVAGNAFVVILSWYSVAFPPVFPQA